VVERRSTEVLAIGDEDVAAALRFVRANAHRALRIEEVCEAIAASRRTLQRKMRVTLGRTLRAEIRRARIERAQRLLRETDQAVAQVGRQCGFRYTHHFSRVFRNEVGCTPSAYRARHRTGG
jgi:LacI family transcriptional regulator